MNSLLKRQISKYLKTEPISEELSLLLTAVNDSYLNYEDQVSMLQRAIQISSEELFEANQKLKQEALSLKEVNQNLTSVLNTMNLEIHKQNEFEEFNAAEYIKAQSEKLLKISKQREELLFSLEKQNQSLNEYAHMVSHDLKAPLRSIDTLINWLIQDNKQNINSGMQETLDMILVNVEKMDSLIKGILDYSAIEKNEIDLRKVDLNEVLDEILRTVFIPSNFELKIQSNFPSIEGNHYKFKQLFQNLISNAIKYNDKKEAFIEVGFEIKENEYEFFVKDNGKGIEPAYHEKIFNIFTKLENNNNSSGIGLSIVKKIIAFYNGRIWLESYPNVGTCFYFVIPKTYGTT